MGAYCRNEPCERPMSHTHTHTCVRLPQYVMARYRQRGAQVHWWRVPRGQEWALSCSPTMLSHWLGAAWVNQGGPPPPPPLLGPLHRGQSQNSKPTSLISHLNGLCAFQILLLCFRHSTRMFKIHSNFQGFNYAVLFESFDL